MSACIEWTGRRNLEGYGRVMDRGSERPAHQVAWERHTGLVVPRGMVVMHTCDRPPCVNPGHLRLGTHADNQHDKVAKGRQAAGARNGRAKLSPGDVAEIRALAATGGRTGHAIAQLYHVDGKTVRDILAGRTWRGEPPGKSREGPEAATSEPSITHDNQTRNGGAEQDRTVGLLNAISRSTEPKP